jgi:glycosyltransferase involved in cell wall biosynthesis
VSIVVNSIGCGCQKRREATDNRRNSVDRFIMRERLDSRNDECPEISVVVPLYDEEDNVTELHRRLGSVLEAMGVSFEILFVNDGSHDKTASMIDSLQERDANLAVLHLSRNFGHQCAITAGLDHARGRAVVVLDGDLQDPPEIVPELVERWRNGYDVVYAVRQHRKEGPLKRLAYYVFYRLLRSISDINIPLDSGDFCLMDRRVVHTLGRLPERIRFIRGLRTFVGFRQIGLTYEREARHVGQSKYSLGALIQLAIDGLVSFSGRPLRLISYIGAVTTMIAIILGVWVIVDAFDAQTAPRGWASLLVVVLFMSSVQLICLGIIGEYIRLIFLEAKGRPSYIVDSFKSCRTFPAENSETGIAPSVADRKAHPPETRGIPES